MSCQLQYQVGTLAVLIGLIQLHLPGPIHLARASGCQVGNSVPSGHSQISEVLLGLGQTQRNDQG